jgi:hypothetical protein
MLAARRRTPIGAPRPTFDGRVAVGTREHGPSHLPGCPRRPASGRGRSGLPRRAGHRRRGRRRRERHPSTAAGPVRGLEVRGQRNSPVSRAGFDRIRAPRGSVPRGAPSRRTPLEGLDLPGGPVVRRSTWNTRRFHVASWSRLGRGSAFRSTWNGSRGRGDLWDRPPEANGRGSTGIRSPLDAAPTGTPASGGWGATSRRRSPHPSSRWGHTVTPLGAHDQSDASPRRCRVPAEAPSPRPAHDGPGRRDASLRRTDGTTLDPSGRPSSTSRPSGPTNADGPDQGPVREDGQGGCAGTVSTPSRTSA